MKPCTLDDLRALKKDVLSPADVAGYLHCDQYVINLRAKEDDLPFTYFKAGNRVKIPREAFIRWAEGAEYAQALADVRRATSALIDTLVEARFQQWIMGGGNEKVRTAQ